MNTRTHLFSLIATSLAVGCGASEAPPPQDPVATGIGMSPFTKDNSNVTTTNSQITVPNTPSSTAASTGPSDSVNPVAATQPQHSPMSAPQRDRDAGATETSFNAPVKSAPSTKPYGDPARAPDNTRTNQRDRNGSTLTPLDQGNSPAEIKITATIRDQLVNDKALSFNAKNIKVITVGTKVTLRGVVKSESEKAAIENYSRKAAGVTEVDNQIEVKK